MFQVNFLPWREKKLKKNCYFWMGFSLLQVFMIVIVVLFIKFYLQSEYQKERTALNLLLEKYEKLKKIEDITQKKLIELKNRQEGIQFYEKIYKKTKKYLNLLNNLSNFMPENCWLMAIKEQDKILILDGISDDYNNIFLFTEKLNQKMLMHNVELQKINQKAKGRFYFTIQLNEF